MFGPNVTDKAALAIAKIQDIWDITKQAAFSANVCHFMINLVNKTNVSDTVQ